MIKTHKFRLLIQSLAILLIASMFITSSPIVTYSEDNVQGENSGGGEGDMKDYAGDFRGWNKTMGGYRLYIINSNLERVSPVYDFVFSNPNNQTIGEVIKSTRFDTDSSPDASTHTIYGMDVLANLAGTDISIIPYPVTASAGHGEEFKNWFLYGTPYSNQGGTGTTGGLIGSGWTPNQPSGNAPEQGLTENTQGSNNPKTIDNFYTSTKSPLSSNHRNIVTIGNSIIYQNPVTNMGNIENASKNVANKLNCNSMLTFYSNEVGYAMNTLKLTQKDAEFYAVHSVYSRIMNIKNGKETVAYITSTQRACINTNVAKFVAYQMFNKYKSQTAELPQNLLDINTLDYLASNTLLTEQIPLAGESTQPAVRLLTDKQGIKVTGYESAMEAIKDNHFLVVEPITWLCVPTGSRKEDYPQARTYGSYYNIANKWASQGGPDEKSFYTSYMTKLGNNCLTVNETMVTESGKTLLPATVKARTISQSVAEMEVSGLSMHIYSSGNNFSTEPSIIEMTYEKSN